MAARESAARFPLVVVAALLGAIAGVAVVEESGDEFWVRLLLTAQLAIPFMFAIEVTAAARAWPPLGRFVAVAAAALALGIYHLALPDDMGRVAITRHVQFTVGLHLLVAFAPFTGAGRLNGFWQYNRALFLRFCLSALYSVVLYGGLVIALAAIDQLLGVDVDENLYMELWFVIASLFNTWFFVGGTPKDILGLDGVADYPRGLKVFAHYILVPLVIVYLVILTIYLGKVIVTQQWPSGWIGYLVSSVAVAGILAHLLVHPIRETAENQWVRVYVRWYYVAMVPPVVMLILAIGKRINQYGVTENRYILAVLAGWLACVSVYFITSRSRNIKWVPTTLCVVAFVTSFGPWGAFSVSHRSQLNRLTGLLERNELLVDGTIQRAENEIALKDRQEISATLDYLVTTHGTDDIAPWFGDRWARIDTLAAIDGPGERRSRYAGSELVRGAMNEMGIAYASPWEGRQTELGYFTVHLDPEPVVLPLNDADAMVNVIDTMSEVEIAHLATTVSWSADPQGYVFVTGGDTLILELDSWVGATLDKYAGLPGLLTISAEEARVEAANDRLHVTLYVETVHGKSTDDGIDIYIYNTAGICFLRRVD
jgi:hypothetical protein